MQQIDRLERPDPEFFVDNYVRKNRPAILLGVADKWKAMRWSPRFFLENFPGINLRYEIWDGNPNVDDPLEFQHAQTYVDTTVAEFIEKMEGVTEPSRKIYCAQFPIFTRIPQLKSDFPSMEPYMGFSRAFPRKLRETLQIDPYLWLGPAGVVSTLHFDRAHNFFVQLHGRKKWVHFPPNAGRALHYPCPDIVDGLFHFSPIDVEKADLDRYPRFAGVKPIETVVYPGELVFTPAGWWHHVRALDRSVSMNFFWLLPAANALSLREYLYLYGRRKALKALGLDALSRRLEA